MFAYFLSYEWGWADELFTYTFCSEFGSAVHNTLEEYANSKGTADYFKVYNKYVAELKPFAKDMNKAPSKARAAFFVEKDCQNCSFWEPRTQVCAVVGQSVGEFKGCPKKLYDDGLAMVTLAIDRYGKYFDTGVKSEDNPTGKIIGVEALADISWGADYEGEDIKMHGFINQGCILMPPGDSIQIISFTGYSLITLGVYRSSMHLPNMMMRQYVERLCSYIIRSKRHVL
jgi:hypothetical protein